MAAVQPQMPDQAPACAYCGAEAVLLKSSAPLYSGRDYGPAWACKCGGGSWVAWVGCHDGTYKPLGRLADQELRRAKIAAHAAFDPIWKARVKAGEKKAPARGSVYKWMAEQLGIPRDQMHIGLLDVDQCKRVVEICVAARSAS